MIFLINMSTNITNKKQDVGDPYLTLMKDVIVVEPRILAVTLYTDIRANIIATPHPKLLKILNSFKIFNSKLVCNNINIGLYRVVYYCTGYKTHKCSHL